MMTPKPSDLRVGNIIYDVWNKVERTVNPVDILNQENAECYEAVELTEDWLFKFGFARRYTSIFEISAHKPLDNSFYTFRVMKVDNGWWFIVDENRSSERVGFNFGVYTYVHQLQNLYFSLTGKELTL